jgi:AraC-like DNA-binding protein
VTFAPRSVVVLDGRPDWSSLSPHPSLRAHVSSYWTVRFEGARHTIRSIPDGSVDVAFDLLAAEPSAFVTGPQSEPRTFTVEGRSDLVAARVAPGASSDLLGAPVTEKDLWAPLARWIGQVAIDVARGIREAATNARRAELLDAFFLSKLAGRSEPDERVDRAIRLVFETRGAARVADLAKAAAASERTLGRLFVERVGTSPKRFARMARFQSLLRRLDGEPDWSGFATEAGYADQAHMIREFKALFGCTPREMLGLRDVLR